MDLTESVNRRWRVLRQTAQQAVDGLIWWGQVREDLRDVLCPFQKWRSISLPELVAMSERVRTWRYIQHRLNFWRSGLDRRGLGVLTSWERTLGMR